MEDAGTSSHPGPATAPAALAAQVPASALQPTSNTASLPAPHPLAARAKPAGAYSLFPAVESTPPATPVAHLQPRHRLIRLQQQQQQQQQQHIQQRQHSSPSRDQSGDLGAVATSSGHRRSTSLDDSARTRPPALSEPRPSWQPSHRPPSSGHGLRVLHTAFSSKHRGRDPQHLKPGSGPDLPIRKRPMSSLPELPPDSPTVPSRFTFRSAQTVWSDDSGHGRASSAPSARPSLESRREDGASGGEDGGGETKGMGEGANDALTPKWMDRQAMASTSTLHGLGLKLAGTGDATVDVQTVQARRRRDKPGLWLDLKQERDEKPPPPPPKSPRHHSRNRSRSASLHSRGSSQASCLSTRPQSPIAVAQSMTILKPTFVTHTHTSSGASSTPSNRTDASAGKPGPTDQPLRKVQNAPDSLKSDSCLSLPSSKFSTSAPSVRSNRSGAGSADGDRTPRPAPRLPGGVAQQAMRSTESVASVIRRSPAGQGPTSPGGAAPVDGNGQWVYRGPRGAAQVPQTGNAGLVAPRALTGGDVPPPTPRKDGSAFPVGLRGERRGEEVGGGAARPRSPRGHAPTAQMAVRPQERAPPSRGPAERGGQVLMPSSDGLNSHPPHAPGRGPLERSELPRAPSRNELDRVQPPRAPSRNQMDRKDPPPARTPPATRSLPKHPTSPPPPTHPTDPAARIKAPSPDLSSSRSTTPDATTHDPRPPRSTADKPTPDLPRSSTPDQGAKVPEDPPETLRSLARQTEALHARYASLRSDRQKLSAAIVSSLKESKAGPEYANTLLDQHLSLAAINSSMDICFAKLKSLECRKEEAMQAAIAQQAGRRKLERARIGTARSQSSLRSVAESGLESGRSTPELERRSPGRPREAKAAITGSKTAAVSGPTKQISDNGRHGTIPSLLSTTAPAGVEEVSSSDVDGAHGKPRKTRIKGAKAAKVLGLVKESGDAGQVHITLPDDVDRGAGLGTSSALLSLATIPTPSPSGASPRTPGPSPNNAVPIPSSPLIPRPPPRPSTSPQKKGVQGAKEECEPGKPRPLPKDTPPLPASAAAAPPPPPTSASPPRAPLPVPPSPKVARKPLPPKSTPAPPAAIVTSLPEQKRSVSGHTPTKSNAPSRADSSSDSAADEDIEARTPRDEEEEKGVEGVEVEEKPFGEAGGKPAGSPALSPGVAMGMGQGRLMDQRLSGRTTVSVMGVDDDLLDYYQQM